MRNSAQIADTQSLAIGVLAVTACVLFAAFLLVTSFAPSAQAIGMNDAAGDYKMATQQLTSSLEGIVIIDAAANRLIVYGFDYNRKQLVPLSGFELDRLQRRPADDNAPVRP